MKYTVTQESPPPRRSGSGRKCGGLIEGIRQLHPGECITVPYRADDDIKKQRSSMEAATSRVRKQFPYRTYTTRSFEIEFKIYRTA